jgi:hypothetical protein
MIVTTVLAAQYAGTLDVSDTTRIGARNTEPVAIVTTTAGRRGEDLIAGDITTTPVARLHMTDRFWEYTLAYAPSITAADFELTFAPVVLHTGTASVGWHGRFVRVVVSEGLSYGELNSAFLNATPTSQGAEATGGTGTGQASTGGTTTGVGSTTSTTAVRTATSAGDIPFGSSNTTGSLAVVTGRHSRVSVSASYFTSGGLNSAAKAAQFPEQYGPSGTVAFSDSVSRTDALTTLVSGGETTTSGICLPPPGQPVPTVNLFCVIQAPFASVQEVVRHTLSDASSLSATIGATAAISRTPYVHEAVIEPILVGTFTESLDAQTAAAVTVSVGFVPTIDVRTGLPSNRGQATVSWAEPFASRTLLVFTGAALQSLPFPVADPYPISSLSGTLEARHRLDRQVDLGLGIQSLWQNQPPYGNLVSTVGYVSLVARLPTARF